MSKTVTIGKVALTPRGEYSSTATYEELDVVRYEGSSYVVNKPCSGITPVEGEYYTLLAEKGEPGKPGDKGDPGDSASLEGGTEGQIPYRKADGGLGWMDPPTGDVESFNGRTGPVVPQAGDYTAEMVGAAEEDHTHTLESLGAAPAEHSHTPVSIGAAAAEHNHDTRYFSKTETMSREQIEQAISEVKEEIEGSGGFSKIYLGAPTNVSVTNLDEGAEIKWTDPSNVEISGSTLATWAGTVVVRKVGSQPTSKTDGTIVVDCKTRDQYKINGFKDTGLVNGTTYYYGVFPYSTDGVYTVDSVTTITPSEILPDPATIGTITNLDEGCTVAFTKPANATSVKIVYKAGSAAATPEEGTAVTGTTSPVTITNLTNGTKYFITVFTMNAKRYNVVSKEFTPTAIYPPKATALSVENLIKSARITYTRPSGISSAKIIYKAGSAPSSDTDGTAVASSASPTTISGLTPGTTYYFKVVTYNAKRYSLSEQTVSVVAREAEHYAFTINDNEAVCRSKITYPAGVDNSNFAAAGLSGSAFSYGSWANAFFIKKLKVVMLNFDGTEAYEINKNNYKQKAAGGTVGTEGNVMVAIPKIYYKVVDNGNGTSTYHFSDVALDADYKCWAHIGIDGQEKDYCYMAAYNGSYVGNKLRSLTGQACMASQTAQEEVNRAVANNPNTSKKNWYTGVLADRLLIQLLLLLIGKNTNTQEQFGQGRTAGSNSNTINTGTMDNKGLFWGDTGGVNGVKVFGIENFWGNIWQRTAGWINANGSQKVKMTHGTQDGSTVNGYNFDGSGYVSINTLPSSFWIKTMTRHKFGLLPAAGAGSATTDYADYCWTNNSQVNYALVGGDWNSAADAGAFYVDLLSTASSTNASLGASLSYKKG